MVFGAKWEIIKAILTIRRITMTFNILSNVHAILILQKLNFSLKLNIALSLRGPLIPMPRKPRQPRHTISGALRRDAFK